MLKIYEDNGLPFFTHHDIINREFLVNYLSRRVNEILTSENRSWLIHRIEAPSLIPTGAISKEYTNDDVFMFWDGHVAPFSLRPETTAASYYYAKYLNDHNQFTPPTCIWQNAKSFRRENDQVTKNMRFKEFYQLEFQCIFTEETKNNYHLAVQEPLRLSIEAITGLETRLIESDRLPSYSRKTMDIEVKTPHKWLEVCSISLRDDVPFEWNGKKLLNAEIAFGTDRLTMLLNKNDNL